MEPGRTDGRAGIDAALVQRLIAAQFPQWAGLPVTPVAVDGWDNRTYRLGEQLSVRLPTHKDYEPAVAKEQRWLPILAPLLPIPVPVPLATGTPGEGYPLRWSVRRWLDGTTASSESVTDLCVFAEAVAGFLRALQNIGVGGGPEAGAHSFYRGAPLEHYDSETRDALTALHDRIDVHRAREVWDAALAATWTGPPRWFHGDIASGNLLVRGGRLAAVIDFGTSGVGDPACDLVVAWTFFANAGRRHFRERVGQDSSMWARARGWALWKALISLAADIDTNANSAAENRRVLHEVLTDRVQA